MFLSLRGITKRFGEVTAVRDVSLGIAEAELVCFLGPSGCGKTTLLRILAGLEIPDAGELLLRGTDLAPIPARLRNFGMVFQSYSLFPNMTARENIAYGLECRKWSAEAVARRVPEMLALVHLADQADKYPHQLSGGQQQRVAVARALAPQPPALLLDEPLSALDAKVREALRGEIRDLHATLGLTTIMVTHDQEEAMEMADRIVVMNAGRVEQIGSATDLYFRPASRFVAEFVGRMNVLRLEPGPDGVPRLGGTPFRVAAGRAEPVRLAGIRPEAIELVDDAADGENHVTGTVQKAVFLGNVAHVTLAVGDQTLLVELRGRARLPPRGAPLTVRLRPDAVRPLGEP